MLVYAEIAEAFEEGILLQHLRVDGRIGYAAGKQSTPDHEPHNRIPPGWMVSIDDNGLYRRKQYAEMRDLREESPIEVEARAVGLNYVDLDGNVGSYPRRFVARV